MTAPVLQPVAPGTAMPPVEGPADAEAGWAPWERVQRIVLRGISAEQVRHRFYRLEGTGPAGPAARQALARLLAHVPGCAAASGQAAQTLQIGFSSAGLRRLGLSEDLLESMAQRSPAFNEGARRRAAELGDLGPSAVETWSAPFDTEEPDLVLSLYGPATDTGKSSARSAAPAPAPADELTAALQAFEAAGWIAAPEEVVGQRPVPSASSTGLGTPLHLQADGQPMMDGITQARIVGVPTRTRPTLPPDDERFRMQPGEFLLGYPNNEGVNAWNRGTGVAWAPGDFEDIFRDGSFAALRVMAIDREAWASYLEAVARERRQAVKEVAGLLLGRGLDGAPLPGLAGPQVPVDTAGWDHFDFDPDRAGQACPYASHIRRMNPRRQQGLVDNAARPLIRRGFPYERSVPGEAGKTEAGLIGHFFCASLDDQFEFLLRQWAQAVPLGARCAPATSAQDPFASGPRDGLPFDFGDGRPSTVPLPSLVRTRGMVYLFYPGLQALQQFAAAADSVTPVAGLWAPPEPEA